MNKVIYAVIAGLGTLLDRTSSYTITYKYNSQQRSSVNTWKRSYRSNSNVKTRPIFSHYMALKLSKSGNENERGDDDEWNKEDYKFMKDLQDAKQKIGTPIGYECTEEAEEAAISAQNDFLEAMKQAKKEFNEAKEELGVDEAINLMKSQWDMEDRLSDVDDDELDEIGEFK